MANVYEAIYNKVVTHRILTGEQKMKIYEGLEKQLYAKRLTREEYSRLQNIVQNIKSK